MTDAYMFWLCKLAARSRRTPGRPTRQDMERVARAHGVPTEELVTFARAKGFVA